MWFTFVTARLFIFLSFQPRLAATLLRSCSVVNSPTRRVGLAPTFKPASLAQAPFPPVKFRAFPLSTRHRPLEHRPDPDDQTRLASAARREHLWIFYFG